MALYVQETGTPGAKSIVFLHGVGTSGWMWWQQTPALADFHCLNVDLPGHGKSNRVEWRSLRDTADQIAALIRTQATKGRAHVVGLSLGGHIALIMLEHHADVLDRVVISGVTAAPLTNRIFLNPQVWLMPILMKWRWLNKVLAESLDLPPEMEPVFTENIVAMSSQAYRRIYKEVAVYRVPPALRQVNTPTLITAGGRESKIIMEAVSVIATMMPHAQGRFAPGMGHGWNIGEPDLFNTMVRAWITGAPLPHQLSYVRV